MFLEKGGSAFCEQFGHMVIWWNVRLDKITCILKDTILTFTSYSYFNWPYCTFACYNLFKYQDTLKKVFS